MDEIKKEFRRGLRKRIAEQDGAFLEKSDREIFEVLSALDEIKKAKEIFAYWSVKKEVDTHRFIKACLKEGKKVFLPVSAPGGSMSFAELTDPELMVAGLYGLPVPPQSGEEAEPDETAVILVPALTFDRKGFRMGQGGGYYDRWLARHSVFSVGLARDSLICPEVPALLHDRSVDCVVSESGAQYYIQPCSASLNAVLTG
ncbi:MAG: 5-formyltetrahydrofolate cyclo-ligase [Oscillospiraceae bacterium]|nr:5-formyltetrahydrofolate cyclo-ligase [Oscillospiraceae bacterium]